MKRLKTKFQGVYQRKSDSRTHNGKLDMCFDVTYALEGKKIWEKAGWASEGYTAKLASLIRSERIRSIRHGKELPKQRRKAPYFKDVAIKYLKWSETNKTRNGKDDFYRYKKHLSPCFDNIRLNEISSFDLERLKSRLMKQELAPATVKQCLILFRQMVNKAIEWRLYNGENPAKGFKMPKVDNKRDRYLSHHEADILLKSLARLSVQLHDETLLSLHCGLRAREVFNLMWNDVDFKHGLITVRDSKSGTRIGYMTKAVKNMLEGRKPFAENQIVFPQQSGDKQNQISNSFRRVVKKIGFNDGITDRRQRFVFHSLRHTFASWHLEGGTDLYTLQRLMGHHSFEMVERYSHLSKKMMQEAVEGLEKSMLPEKEESKKLIALK